MRSALLTIAVTLLIAASTASAVTIGDEWGRQRIQPWQGWADASLIPLPAATFVVHYAPCPRPTVGGFGCTMADIGEIYVDPASPASERRRILLHEIGHMIDARYMADAERDAFRRVAHALPGPWLDNSSPLPSAGEQFAEAVSLCAIHRTFDPYKTRGWWSAQWRPGPRRHLKVCAWLQVLAARWG